MTSKENKEECVVTDKERLLQKAYEFQKEITQSGLFPNDAHPIYISMSEIIVDIKTGRFQCVK